MDERALTCCFTGHRPMKLPWGMNEDDPRCVSLKQELDARMEAIYELGYRRFLCGIENRVRQPLAFEAREPPSQIQRPVLRQHQAEIGVRSLAEDRKPQAG